ncbi:MAG: TIGR01212 family radical SAM protein [Lachnospiraceae bacterium]|nr:TIGR01212 family radical SAM protein [Lachnospiraceae bacterium]
MILLNDYLRQRFGCKVYKLALSADVTCPNRDGTLGTRGCIFCSAGGSGDFAVGPCQSVARQIEEAKARVAAKVPAGSRYIAYFQSFTNTYGDPAYFRRIWYEAIKEPEVAVLAIGTRPDCLSDEILDLLAEINAVKPVWVELGLQTIHPASAAYIRRGYDLPVFDEAVKKLRAIGIEVIVHVILGLPGESDEAMKETVRYVCDAGVQGLKLQLLHVLKGTDLAADYEAGKVPIMEMDHYVRLLGELCAELPENMVVHRLTGDGPKKLLLAPLWTADKKRVMNAVRQELVRRNLV